MKQSYCTYNKPLSVMGLGGGVASLSFKGASSKYDSGTFYPIFGIKMDTSGFVPYTYNDISMDIPNATKIEQPVQRALSFDTTNTTELDGTETTSAILSIMDTSLYTCNSDFGTGGETIKAIKIAHYNTSGTLENEGEFAFTGSSFNIYDHLCNALPNAFDSTNSKYTLPSQMGTLTSASLDGTAITPTGSYTLQNYIFVNGSSYSGSSNSNSYGSWSNDDGDYCFLGISDKAHFTNNGDNFDTGFGTTKGLAFGITDSDGRATVSGVQYPPRTISLGLSRRSYKYRSLHTNMASTDQAAVDAGHNGLTEEGYFIVYGKPS